MEIRQWAEGLLFASSISDKLTPLASFSDDSPGTSIAVPSQPGRPHELHWAGEGSQSFPSLHLLEDEKVRGQILHFFANHELLALELMALALLRFPQADKKFRAGLVGIIQDEQKHMRFYMQRMCEFGIGLGDFSANRFFWNCLVESKTVSEFTSGLSLTFEQANLDFSLFYEKAFRQIGDHVTADHLHTVYEDELRHVGHGLHWFKSWQHTENLWQSYCRSLHFPLTPQRAKGKEYDSESRRRAGFDEDYITQLAVYSHSKGNAPRVFFFNPDCEIRLAIGPTAIAPKALDDVATSLDTLPTFLATATDLILVRRPPTIEWLSAVRSAGFELPAFATITNQKNNWNLQANRWPDLNINSLPTKKIFSFQPWGWTAEAKCFVQPVCEYANRLPPPISDEDLRKIYAKSYSAELLKKFLHENAENFICSHDVCGQVIHTFDDLNRIYAEYTAHGQATVIKCPYGTSGRNLRILGVQGAQGAQNTPGNTKLKEEDQKWIARHLHEQGHLVIEPWLRKVFDYSLQVQILPDGRGKLEGVSRFFTSAGGHYRGAFLGGFATGLSNEVQRELGDHGRDSGRLRRHWKSLVDFIARELHALNYAGPVGIDALAYRTPTGELKIKPIVEINPRYTMGAVQVQIEKKLARSGVGLWRICHRHELKQYGFSSAKEFAEHFSKTLAPLARATDPRIIQGLITNDARENDAFISFLVMAPDLSRLKTWLTQYIPGAARDLA